ncbi:MAG: M91 family zinc metallopeptidase [Bryobacteraceae bacterium]|jgi:hypothetical protein
MGDREKVVDSAKKEPDLPKDSPSVNCSPKTGGIEWKKAPGATDEDLKAAQKMWEDAKKRRLPDGTKPKTVEAMEALENSDKKTVLEIGPGGNSTTPGSWTDAADPKKGSGSTIKFDPNKKGNLSDGTERDPECSLAHEAVHASEMSQGALTGEVKDMEIRATGAENEARKAKGLPQRKKYGAWDIPQK